MHFSTLDYGIVIFYLIAVAFFGIYTSGKQTNVKDYFLGSKRGDVLPVECKISKLYLIAKKGRRNCSAIGLGI